MCSAPGHWERLRSSRKRFNGYTLIETLVAMAVFTAILFLAGVAINQGLRQYQGLMEQGIGFWDHAKLIWIDKSFNSMTDYYVYRRSDGWFPYFKGTQEGISYVSLAPFAGILPMVVWIKNEAQRDGKRTLKYYELPIYTKTIEDLERDEYFEDYKKGQSIYILTDLENVSFSFYQCDFASEKCRWVNMYDGSKAKMLPASVKIEYTQRGAKGALSFDIHVNSRLKMTYNDNYVK